WNRPLFYFNDDDDEYVVIWRRPKAITPDEPIEEPDNSLSMGDEHLDTISSVEILVPITSEFEGISNDTCDVPVGEDSSIFDALSDHSEILSDSNNDDTSRDDDDFEDVEYVILEEVNDVDQEEKEFDLEDIFQIQDVILRDKLLNEIDTSRSLLDKSLPEFRLISNHTARKRHEKWQVLVSTTTHANYSHSEYDSFLFEIESDQEGLISNDNSNDPFLELPEFESFHFDLSFSLPPPEPPDVEICLHFEPMLRD
ncbi:hypothetical protein Tco_0698276, partial [Tanacetum coccineum]